MPLKHAQRGASILTWILALPILFAFGIFAVDMNNLHLAHAELQAAADAGALKGAQLLYVRDADDPDLEGELNTPAITGKDGYDKRDGTPEDSALTGANDAALRIQSRGDNVEIVSVELGHWRFRRSGDAVVDGIERGGTFTAWDGNRANLATLVNPSTDDFYDVLTLNQFDGLGGRPMDVNAVRVVVERNTTPVQSFFRNFLGRDNFQTSATSVGYVGFAGTIAPTAPFALCVDSIRSGTAGNYQYSCNAGFRFGNDGDLKWANRTSPCAGNDGVNKPELVDMIDDMPQCKTGAPGLGVEMTYASTVEASLTSVTQAAYKEIRDCWWADANAYSGIPGRDTDDGPDLFWPMTIPLIDCVNAPTEFNNCATIYGTISVNVIWINGDGDEGKINDNPNKPSNVPMHMEDWDGSDSGALYERWNDFMREFNVLDPDTGSPVELCTSNKPNDCESFKASSIYLAPDCNFESSGNTGGSINFGIRAAEPVLVY